MNKQIKIGLIIIVIMSFIVMFFSLKDNFNDTINYLVSLNIFYIFVAFLLMLLNILFQSLSLYNFIKKIDNNYKLTSALSLTSAGLFFNGITPFQSGGQPFQIYLLKKNNIKVSDSTNILLQNFLTFQISLILIGTVSIIINGIIGIFPKENLLKEAVILGYIINCAVLFFLFFFSYAKQFNTKILSKLFNIIYRIKFIKNPKNIVDRLNDTLENFYTGSVSLKKNFKNFGISFIFNTLSLLCLYLIPLFIFYALGDYYSLTPLNSIVSSGYTFLIGSFVPIPGGSGGLEYSFNDFFKTFSSGGFLSCALIVWRLITYYFGIVIGGLVLLFYKKREEE